MNDDNRPFPIQRTLSRDKRSMLSASSIPWWLAEIAYAEYQRIWKTNQTIERIAERGGFDRWELLDFLKLTNNE